MTYPNGEQHHMARLTDEDCTLIRALREETGMSYKKIADKFECGESTVRDIAEYRTRYRRQGCG